jgi:hypothetical protein
MSFMLLFLGIIAAGVLIFGFGIIACEAEPALREASQENAELPPIEQLLLWEACGAGGRTAIAAHLIVQARLQSPAARRLSTAKRRTLPGRAYLPGGTPKGL